MNATNVVHDTFLYGAVGALMGLLFGVAAYVGTMTLWHIAVGLAGGLVLGVVSGLCSEEDEGRRDEPQ